MTMTRLVWDGWLLLMTQRHLLIKTALLVTKHLLWAQRRLLNWKKKIGDFLVKQLPSAKISGGQIFSKNLLTPESRADYFKERRNRFKSFTVEVEREKMERLEQKLSDQKTTKAKWLNQKIDEEIGE